MQFWVPGDLVKPEDDGTLLSKGFMLGIGLWNSTPSMPVTAESVGWLSLLAKAFHILRELLSISDDNSVLGLAAAHRLLLELHVQLHTITSPLIAASDPAAPDSKTATEVRKNLRLYATWASIVS